MATVANLDEALVALNAAQTRLGYKDAPEITAENLDTIGALPEADQIAILNEAGLIYEKKIRKANFDRSKNAFRGIYREIPYGNSIEDVHMKYLTGRPAMWDRSQYSNQDIVEDLVSYVADEYTKKIHITKVNNQIPVYFSKRQLKKIFTPEGIVDYMTTKVAVLSDSMELWLQDTGLDLTKEVVDSGNMIVKNGYDMSTQAGIKKLLEDVRSTASGMLKPSTLYNKEGIRTNCDSKEDLFLLATPEIIERIRVQEFSGAYNMDQENFPATIIEIPNGTSLGTDNESGKDALMVLMDKNTLVLGILGWDLTEFFIPNTLDYKNWLTAEVLKSFNTFTNAVAFCGDFDDIA